MRIVAIAALIPAVLTAAACSGGESSSAPPSAPLELQEAYEAIVQGVALGSTEEEILQYLDGQAILHDSPDKLGRYPQRVLVPPLEELPDSTPVIRAQLDEAAANGARWDVFFILDEEGRLVEIVPIDYLPSGLRTR